MTKEEEFRKQTEEAKFESFAIMCKKVANLEKENGKLEGKLADWQSEYIELENYKNNEIKELKAQLTKAKEIIQTMLRDIPNRMWYTDATIKEAEQFLKEAE